MDSNGTNRCLSITDFVVDDAEEVNSETSFFDPANPILAPAKPIEARKKRSWKRKLFAWGFVVLLIVGGGFLLYSLLKVKRVNVRVLADNRNSAQSAKPGPSPT